MTTRSELQDKLKDYAYDPSALQREMVRQTRLTFTGELDAMSPMSPFVFLMESAATLSAMGMNQAAVLNQRQYPSMAQTFDDLYLHMSDKDYIGRFGRPAPTTMRILLGKDEVIQKAVLVPNSNIRKLQIPRHSFITVDGLVFTMQYPIDIRVMPHGGLQIVYDNERPSPLYGLESNRVTWAIRNYNPEHIEMLELTVPVHQFEIVSRQEVVSPIQTFSKKYPFKDSYYHCRVYRKVGGDWREIPTTHTGLNYDPLHPTAVLKVLPGELEVSFPTVYQNSSLLSGDVRIDIYTTRGEIDVMLGGYGTNQFKFDWRDYDEDDSRYSAPLSTMTLIQAYSDQTVMGGRDAMTFEELRDRVTTNSLSGSNLPITNAQISYHLEDLGYDLIKNVDLITNRQFIATKVMPIPADTQLVSGVGSMVGRLAFTYDSISDRSFVADNGNRLTIKPDALYRHDNGVTTLITENEMQSILSLSGEALVEKVNGADYLYTPFHYVLDINDNNFVTRPYYLGDGEITGKQFIDENGTLGLQVSTAAHVIKRAETGWKLRIATQSSEEFRDLPDDEVFVQLSIRPLGEARPAFVNGRLIGRTSADNERIYEFDIDTNWDVNSDDEITLTSFAMFSVDTAPFRLDLTAEYDIIYAVRDPQYPGQQSSSIDNALGMFLLPSNVVGLYHERLLIELGQELSGLWQRARSTVTDLDYVRHSEDVYAVYEHNVYARDANGPIIEIVNNKPEFILLHAAGDRIKDSDGNDVLLYKKGSPVLDASGNPVIENGRRIRREMDIVLFDGAFYFATTASDVRQRDGIVDVVLEALDNDLAANRTQLLEQTKIAFRPRTTMGLVDVTIGELFNTQIRAEQEVFVTLYVRRSVYRDNDLRAALTSTTARTVAEQLERTVVTTSDIISTLRAALGDDVIAVDLMDVAGQSAAITLRDVGSRLSIGKRLLQMPDGSLAVQDTINVSFLLHTEG